MLSHVDLQSGEPGPGRPSTHEQYSARPTEGQEESPGRCASASGHHCWVCGPSDLPGHQRSIPFTASLGRPLPGRRESARPSLLSLTVFCRPPPLPSRPALSIAAMSSLSCRRHGRQAPLGHLPSQGARLDVSLSVSSRALQGAQLDAQRQSRGRLPRTKPHVRVNFHISPSLSGSCSAPRGPWGTAGPLGGGPETQASNLSLPLPWDLTCVVFPVVKDWGSPVSMRCPHTHPVLAEGPQRPSPLTSSILRS